MLGLPQGDGRGGLSQHSQTGIAQESLVPDPLIHPQHKEVSLEMVKKRFTEAEKIAKVTKCC